MSSPLPAAPAMFSLISGLLCARTLRPRQIVLRLRPLDQPAGPALEHLCHPLRLDAELRHRNAAIDGLAVLRDQPVPHDEAAHAVDDDALALELRDGGREARQRPGIAHAAVKDGIEHLPAI